MNCPRCERELDVSDYIIRGACPYCFKILKYKEDEESGDHY